jgi:RNA polymerase sigma-70 factor (ECF subfamily)
VPYKKNSHSFKELSADDHKDIHAFATRRVGGQEADDIVQDAYLQLLSRDDKDLIREPRAFLFRVIANLSIDSWRKSKRRTDTEHENQGLDLDTLACRQPGPEAVIGSLLEFDNFLFALDQLPALQRHAFILNKIEGLTHAEIAERLGVSSKSIQRYLVDAMEHFACRLDNSPP